MPNNITESFQPVLETEITKELKRKFRGLCREVFMFYHTIEDGDNDESVKAAAEILHQHVTEEVTAHPILARVTSEKWKVGPLLHVACESIFCHCLQTIMFLIETNPHVLLWVCARSNRTAIHTIAGNANCKLLPWIMKRYPWVFQHELCRSKPPHLDMMKLYVSGGCDAETVLNFYKLYPEGLRERDASQSTSSYPLLLSLAGLHEPDADVFIWMAKQCSSPVHHGLIPGNNILHTVCSLLADRVNENFPGILPNKCTPNMVKICNFLIVEHSYLVRKKSVHGRYLPIHKLVDCCDRPLVRLIVCLLLRAYPECAHVKGGRLRPELSTVPFIQQVHPLIVEELAIDRETAQLPQIAQNMKTAAVLAANYYTSTSARPGFHYARFGSVAEIFSSWASLRVCLVLPAWKKQVQTSIADACCLTEGEICSTNSGWRRTKTTGMHFDALPSLVTF